jgi:hypothetical protein
MVTSVRSSSINFFSNRSLSFQGGDTNLYRYVGNTPTSFTDPSGLERLSKNDVNQIREELRRAGLSEAEIRFRLKVLENVHNGKVHFPNPKKKLFETRNSEFWKETGDGYVPRGDASSAINDLWKSKNGIQCYKYSSIIMLKSHLDVADADRLKELNRMFKDKVLPNDLESEGDGVFYENLTPKNGDTFGVDELLPGDQIWFENPYFERLKPERQDDEDFTGEQGSNIFYAGNGKVISIYGGNVMSLDAYRRGMLQWATVSQWNKYRDPDASKDDFQIKSVRRPICP